MRKSEASSAACPRTNVNPSRRQIPTAQCAPSHGQGVRFRRAGAQAARAAPTRPRTDISAAACRPRSQPDTTEREQDPLFIDDFPVAIPVVAEELFQPLEHFIFRHNAPSSSRIAVRQKSCSSRPDKPALGRRGANAAQGSSRERAPASALPQQSPSDASDTMYTQPCEIPTAHLNSPLSRRRRDCQSEFSLWMWTMTPQLPKRLRESFLTAGRLMSW